jgi:hypothetical protein
LSEDNGSFLQEFSQGLTAFNAPLNVSAGGIGTLNFEMLIKVNELKVSVKELC